MGHPRTSCPHLGTHRRASPSTLLWSWCMCHYLVPFQSSPLMNQAFSPSSLTGSYPEMITTRVWKKTLKFIVAKDTHLGKQDELGSEACQLQGPCPLHLLPMPTGPDSLDSDPPPPWDPGMSLRHCKGLQGGPSGTMPAPR